MLATRNKPETSIMWSELHQRTPFIFSVRLLFCSVSDFEFHPLKEAHSKVDTHKNMGETGIELSFHTIVTKEGGSSCFQKSSESLRAQLRAVFFPSEQCLPKIASLYIIFLLLLACWLEIKDVSITNKHGNTMMKWGTNKLHLRYNYYF